MQVPVIISARYPGGELRLDTMQGTQDFRLADVEVEVDLMAGKTTNGSAGWGRVMRIMPGVGFEVDNGTQRSILWSQFWLLQPTLKQMVQTTRSASDLRRTDSGADYGQPGYPDCAWWEAQGVEDPLFVATPSVYGRYAAAPTLQVERLLLQELLAEAEPDLEEEGPFRRAWNRQKAQCVLGAFQAALAAPVPAGERCSAPVRSLADLLPAHLRPAPLVVRAEKPVRGQGIVGFSEPSKEGKTQREFRAALLPAIRAWLTESLPRQAREAALDWDIDTLAGKTDIVRGVWPGARLYHLTEATDGSRFGSHSTAGIRWPWAPADYSDRYYACALWAADVCEKFLTGSGRVDEDQERMALRFLTVDTLPDGRTLMDLWNWSRFGPLAAAPPLPDDEDDLAAPAAVNPRQRDDEDDDAEEESEDEDDGAGLLGVDLEVVLAKHYTVSFPGWLWAGLAGWLLTYLWMVGFLIGRR